MKLLFSKKAARDYAKLPQTIQKKADKLEEDSIHLLTVGSHDQGLGKK